MGKECGKNNEVQAKKARDLWHGRVSNDTLAKAMWRGNAQFADLFNALVYHRRRIDPNKLREGDTDLSTLTVDKELRETISSHRDVTKYSEEGEFLQILAIENQQELHYAMPLRCLLYDTLSFYHQYKRKPCSLQPAHCRMG